MDLMDVSEVMKIPKGKIFHDRLAPEYFESLKNDIRENGVKEPIILKYYNKNRTLRVQDGHHHLAIAHELGLKSIPVKINVVWNRDMFDDDSNDDILTQRPYIPPKMLDVDKYRKMDYYPSSVSPEELGLNNNINENTKMKQETKKLFENFKLLNSDFNLNEATFTDTFSAGNQTNTTTTTPTQPAPVKPQNQPSDVAALSKRTTNATAVQKAASRINTVNEFSGAFKNWFSSLGYKPDNNAISIGKTVSLIRAAMSEMGYK